MYSSILSLLTLGLSVAGLPTEDYLSPSITEEQMADRGLTIEVLPILDLPLVKSTSHLHRRQDIDFALVDSLPDPVATPSSAYNQSSALAAVVANINNDPLIQKRNSAGSRRAVTGYTDSISLGNAALNAPLNCNGADTYMGSKLWADTTFDEARCAVACTAQSAYNLKHPPSKGSPKLCQFYNTYVLYKNDVPQGQYCSLYTQAWDTTKATNKGQYRGSDHYTIQQSVMATNATNSGDVSCPSDVSYLMSSGQDFCTSYLGYIAPATTFTATTTPATFIVTSVQTDQTIETVYSTLSQSSIVATTTLTVNNKKRAIQTPVSVSSWSPSRISAACASVATGSISTTITTAASTPVSTLLLTTLQTVVTTLTTTEVASITATSTTTKSAPKEMVTDGGFESTDKSLGNAPGWTQSYRARPVVGGASGAHSGVAYMVVEPMNLRPATIAQTLTNLDTSPNTGTLSFWYKRFNNPATCELTVSLGSTIILTDRWVNTVYINKGTWEFKSIPFITAPASTADLEFSVVCDRNYVSYHFDDVSFTQST